MEAAMSARLTIVLDDEDLYRDLKVRAAREGVPLKRVVEQALRAFLEAGEREAPAFSWEKWMEHRRSAEELDEELGPGPEDLSDIKHHLCGWPKHGQVAEDRAAYDEPPDR
jgi:hypothetical protein